MPHLIRFIAADSHQVSLSVGVSRNEADLHVQDRLAARARSCCGLVLESSTHRWCSAVSSQDPSASPTFPVLHGLFGELSTTLGKDLS